MRSTIGRFEVSASRSQMSAIRPSEVRTMAWTRLSAVAVIGHIQLRG